MADNVSPKIYIESLKSHANGSSCSIQTITNSTIIDYTKCTVFTDIILFDATAGPINLTLVIDNLLTNQIYTLKRIDATANIVTIFPPAGETINAGVSLVLSPADTIQIIHYAPDWIIINASSTTQLTTKGDLLTRTTTTLTRLPVGTDGQVLSADSSTPTGLKWISNTSSSANFIIRDEKIKGMQGGTFVSDTWLVRDLNVTSGSLTSITLSANQLILDPGTYFIQGSSPAVMVKEHQIRLQNITDGTTLLYGTSEYSNSITGTRSCISGNFTIASIKVLEIQHWCVKNRLYDGLGRALGKQPEVYSEFTITNVS
jgi:hypothetical protein